MSKAKCLDCNYVGSKGIWEGKYTFDRPVISREPTNVIRTSSSVSLCKDGTWDLSNNIKSLERMFSGDILNFEGEARCPICRSNNFY